MLWQPRFKGFGSRRRRLRGVGSRLLRQKGIGSRMQPRPRSFGSIRQPSKRSEPLGHRLKLIQVVVKMMDTTTAKYEEVPRWVATFGILHHLEDVGSVVLLVAEVAPVTFGGERLQALSPAVVATWKVF
ncbi:hypothetical protein GUJ93_ZPchr0002g22993 [Zizania palustris]|uniref:Uncharacterized protein n=1 Tax=Zizania palustris TaxID=103762 RepID=A0A8J5V375_ZIZPA|nr:hypothetical protein GUJ93_ZPchr0002g22993 [Zizania palustris]